MTFKQFLLRNGRLQQLAQHLQRSIFDLYCKLISISAYLQLCLNVLFKQFPLSFPQRNHSWAYENNSVGGEEYIEIVYELLIDKYTGRLLTLNN